MSSPLCTPSLSRVPGHVLLEVSGSKMSLSMSALQRVGLAGIYTERGDQGYLHPVLTGNLTLLITCSQQPTISLLTSIPSVTAFSTHL